ncbi:MAG: type II toxin-antitoxin system RelE/ParE family toxin [Candidatus Daviesbacteria bacterium]|nr:type II toxin-antitoxin system RelE/ParE family toxin [Candidatus Daviesbacteria bacterium]
MEVIFFSPTIKNSLHSLEKHARSKSSQYIDLLGRFGNKLGMPYSKKITRNLFELRIRGQQEVRIFYCFHQDKAVIVHFFIKKSQKTPRKEIQTALGRIALLT